VLPVAQIELQVCPEVVGVVLAGTFIITEVRGVNFSVFIAALHIIATVHAELMEHIMLICRHAAGPQLLKPLLPMLNAGLLMTANLVDVL
jgi:hypothetical protein